MSIPGSSISDDGVSHDYVADFDPTSAAHLNSGQRYAVAITTTDTVQNAWNYSEGNPCPDGALYIEGPPFEAKINQKKRRATFRFTSGDQGARFLCKLDRKPYRPCTSPKTYRNLKPAKHRFKVRSVDPAGNLDATPATYRFRIRG